MFGEQRLVWLEPIVPPPPFQTQLQEPRNERLDAETEHRLRQTWVLATL